MLSLFSASQVPENAFAVFGVRRTERFGEITLLAQHLKMKRERCEQRKNAVERIKVHQQNAEIHEIEAEESGVTAEFIDSRRNERRLRTVGNADAPAPAHTDDGDEKERIADNAD